MALIKRLKDREDGQTIIEYALVIGSISLALIVLFVTADLTGAFATLITNIKNAMT
jgi:Flp pilus assembly pilin Flp